MLHKSVAVTFLLFLLLLFSAGMASAHTNDKVYTADRFDISAQVLPTNTLRVTETEVFHFSGGTFSFVTRELPTDNTDGITVLSASIDGQSMSEGLATGQYEEDDGNPITVTWHFMAQPETTHTFTLTYDIKGIIQKHPQQDLIDWKPLPDQYSYPIRSSTITITYPQSAALVQKPKVVQGTATVSAAPGQVIYRASNLEANQPLELGLRFRPGLVSQEPVWQQNDEVQQQNTKMSAKSWRPMLAMGLLIALLGLFFVVWRNRYYRHSSSRPSTAQQIKLKVTTPPGDLPPALAGVLVKAHDGNPSWSQALSTIFSLMDRSVIGITQSTPESGETVFHLMLLNRLPDLRPHEAVLVDILFKKQSGDARPRVSITQAGKRYRWKALTFKQAVQEEMVAREIMNGRQLGIHRLLGYTSSSLFFLTPLLLCILLIVGPWELIFLPLGFLIVGVAAFIMRSTFSVYNKQNAQVALRWKAFAEHLHQLTLGEEAQEKDALKEEDVPAYLSYATAFDLIMEWASTVTIENYGIHALPSWFRELMAIEQIPNMQAYHEFHSMCQDAHRAGKIISNRNNNGSRSNNKISHRNNNDGGSNRSNSNRNNNNRSNSNGGGGISFGSNMGGSSGAAGGGSSSAG